MRLGRLALERDELQALGHEALGRRAVQAPGVLEEHEVAAVAAGEGEHRLNIDARDRRLYEKPVVLDRTARPGLGSADHHQEENMSASVHSAIDEVLEQAVDSGAVPNVVAIAADRDGIIYEGGAGPRAPGESGTVDADTRFRIMSMTKMVATVAALQLAEQSKLDLDAPVEEYCPDFAQVQVLERVDGGTPVLRAPASKATVRQLITHTSGLGYWFWNSGVRRVGAGHRHAQRALGLERDLQRPDGR